MSANEALPSAHGLVAASDPEAPKTNLSCTGIPCEMWMEIAKNLDGLDLLSLSSVRKLMSSLFVRTPKAELGLDFSDLQVPVFVSILKSVLDPIPQIRVPQVWSVSADLPCKHDVDFSD